VSGTATITNPSSPTTSITGLLPGTTVLSWTISNSPCTSSTDDVAIKVYEKPTIADAGLDINLPCGVTTTTLSANTPLVGTGNWSVVSGTATITNPSSPTTSITDLVIPDTVVLRWTISNPPCANSFDDVVITTKACFTCGVDNLTDSRDGNTYQTVQIGTQCWMKENLKYLPSVVGSATGSNTVPYYYVYGYNGTDVFTAKAQPNYSVYGVLYNWPAAMAGAASSNNNPSGVQGVCPSGWHLPSDAEWQQLELYIGMDPSVLNNTGWRGTNEGGKLKETGTLHWTSPNTGATNVSGFTGLGGGFRYNDGTFLSSLTGAGRWWSATEDASYVHGRGLQYDRSTFGRGGDYKEWGFSVRCVKD
ncbi:MAG TPA: fibrobacter succinogenes major paralogous domain-containing protein, partial [Bacteroidales bacterium]|nr:fibrobacter succinogenes major paralogous domain-containing protein [Bacteroidales bacterium]